MMRGHNPLVTTRVSSSTMKFTAAGVLAILIGATGT